MINTTDGASQYTSRGDTPHGGCLKLTQDGYWRVVTHPACQLPALSRVEQIHIQA